VARSRIVVRIASCGVAVIGPATTMNTPPASEHVFAFDPLRVVFLVAAVRSTVIPRVRCLGGRCLGEVLPSACAIRRRRPDAGSTDIGP
jgi:hypothetical protein